MAGGGVLDHHREAAGQDASRMENDKFIFFGGALGGAGQRLASKQERKPILTPNQSPSRLRPGSLPCCAIQSAPDVVKG